MKESVSKRPRQKSLNLFGTLSFLLSNDFEADNTLLHDVYQLIEKYE